MYSSQSNHTTEQNPQTIQNTSEKTKVISYLTPRAITSTSQVTSDADTTSDLTPQVIKPVDVAPTPSNFLTTVTYGFLKHVGKTDYEIFMDLSKSGTLKADYETNLNEAFNRLNAAARERFKEKNLLSAQQQKKIATLFTTASSIDSDFVLAKALAAEYFTLQKEALGKTLEKQAKEIEPALRKKRNDIIQQADQEYIDALTAELNHTKDTALNSRYLYSNAGSNENFEKQNENHYKDIETFSQLLATINRNVEIANNENLYHLPKTK